MQIKLRRLASVEHSQGAKVRSPSAMNICGCVVETRAQDAAAVAQRLLDLPGVGLHASDGGKLVVTVEDTAEAQAADTLAALGQVAGVLNTSLIYHYGGDEPLEDGDRDYQSA
jgi:nitrate reductase NapAB chaperone NapD